VNAALGTVLWASYAEATTFLEPRVGIYTATLSGAFAGGMQAVLAAPAENVRLVLEGGTKEGWSHAWREVFTSPQISSGAIPALKPKSLHEIRQVRDWMREVGGMAGRGWEGWGWGCAKDMCGEHGLSLRCPHQGPYADKISPCTKSQALPHSSQFLR
jgi:hypothetical protein